MGSISIDAEELMNRVKSVSTRGDTVENSQTNYVKWAGSYDQDLLQHGYSSHVAVARKLCENISKDKRSSVRVLDIGAGTGLVAKVLREQGFTNIDALDPSQAMLDEAKKDKLYNQYILDYITEKPSNIPSGSYDALTGSGIFTEEAHVQCDALVEMVRLVKKGGLIVVICRCNLLGTNGVHERLEPFMQKLINEKKWELVSRDSWQKYFLDTDAIVWCYKVL